MKRLIFLCIFLIPALSSWAQDTAEKRSAFQLSFFPPLSTNGLHAGEYTNGASFNILAGISRNEQAFAFASIGNIVRNDAKGLQFAGVVNAVGHDASGLMLSGVAGIVGNNFRGFQFGGVFNRAREMKGLQLGGVANISSDSKGFQFAGVTNVSAGMKGFQFAGVGNLAGDIRGFQFGGVFNVAKNVSGVQFAGLVNIAEHNDYPIALLNIIKNGEYGISVTYNDMGSILASLRSGGRVTYGIIGVGYNHKTHDGSFVIEGGFGAHINVNSWLRINNELKGGSLDSFSDNSDYYFNYAFMPAFRIVRHLEIFGGPSINYLNSQDMRNSKIFPSHSLWKKHTDSRMQQLYVGFQAGVHFLF